MIGPRSPQLHAHEYPMPRNAEQRFSSLYASSFTARTVTA
jgi:hypothetical protein